MVVLILTTLGMIRLETARKARESDFAEAMSLASSARPAGAPQQAMMSIRAIRTMPDRPGAIRKSCEFESLAAFPPCKRTTIRALPTLGTNTGIQLALSFRVRLVRHTAWKGVF